jgi:phage-related minor tail protein
MAEELSKLSVVFLLDTKGFEKALTDTQKKMRRVGREMSDLGKKMSIGLTVPIALAGKKIVETATAFEYQMARVQAISGATSQGFSQLSNNAEKLGASTIFTAREVGALQEEFAKLGFSSEEIVKVTESTLSLAQVTGATLPRAAEVAGATLRTFNMQASQVGQVNDMVAVAISKSALDFESFAETMKYAGSQAAVSGIGMSELGAAMGVLANRGVKGSIAGTRLRMIFAKLTQEGGDTHQKFLDLIHGSMTMTEAIDRFGIRAATAIPVLQENAAEFDNLERSMALSSGTLEIMQETMDDTSFAAQKKLKSAMEDVSIQIGKVLLPIVNALANFLTIIANGFAGLPKFIKVVIVIVTGLVAAIGPLLLVLGTLSISMVSIQLLSPSVAAALSTMLGPVGLLVTAFSILGLALISTIKIQKDVESFSDRMARANERASESTVKNTATINTLIGAYENENRTLAEKQEILDKLAQLQPEYFEDLAAESTTIETLKGKYDDLFAAMMKMEKAKAFMAEANRLQSERVQLLLEQDRAQSRLNEIDTRAAAGESGYAPTQSIREGTYQDPKFFEKGELNKTINNIDDDLDELDAQGERLKEIMTEKGYFELLLGDSTDKTGTPSSLEKAIQDQLDIMEKLERELKIIGKRDVELGLTDLEVQKEKLKAYTTAFNGLIEAGVDGADVAGNIAIVGDAVHLLSTNIGRAEDLEGLGKVLSKLFSDLEKAGTLFATTEKSPVDVLARLKTEFAATGKALQALKSEYPLATQAIEEQTAAYEALATAIKVAEGAVEEYNLKQDITKHLQQGVIDGSFAMGTAFSALADSTKDFGQAMLEALTSTLSALVRQIYMTYALKTIESGKDPISTIALLGVGAGALSGFLNSIPKLAKGGIAVGPQLAMVGDNRSGREAIIPLEKLPGLMQKMGGGNGGRLYGTIQGYDLVLSNERNNRLMQRASR